MGGIAGALPIPNSHAKRSSTVRNVEPTKKCLVRRAAARPSNAPSPLPLVTPNAFSRPPSLSTIPSPPHRTHHHLLLPPGLCSQMRPEMYAKCLLTITTAKRCMFMSRKGRWRILKILLRSSQVFKILVAFENGSKSTSLADFPIVATREDRSLPLPSCDPPAGSSISEREI